MTSWKNLLLDEDSLTEPSDFLQDPSLLWNSRVCSNLRIEKHFKSMEASSSQLDKYIKVLTQCAERNGTMYNLKEVNMTDLSTKIENQYHNTFTSFTSDYWHILNHPIEEAAALIAWTTLESTTMLHQYMEAQKWNGAVQACKNQQIPWTLINTQSLKELLTSLKNGYMEDSHDFAIPLETISTYFKLPLSDCIFGDDNTFLVRLMVPLIPNEASFKNYFVKFRPIPFVTQGKICSLWNGEESIPFNVGFNGIMPCSCSKSDIFCRAWNTEIQDPCSSVQRTQEECLHALASDMEQEITDFCPMKCRSNIPAQPKEQYRDLILQKNDTDTVKIIPAVVNEDSDRATFVECPGKRMPIPLLNVGAYQLSIPNQCQIVNEESYVPINKSVVANVEKVKVTHLMPYHWRNGITALDSSDDASISFVDKVDRVEGVVPKMNLIASKLEQLDQTSNRAFSDTFLWLLVLLSLLMNVGLVVVVVQLQYWKKDQVYKNNRLVYSIGPDPDDDIRNFPGIGDQQTRPLCDADSL